MKRTAILFVILAASALPAHAHTGLGHTPGLLAGLVHPLLGIDHLMALLGFGIWTALAMPRRAMFVIPGFVAAMLAGAALGYGGVVLPAVESLVAASVLVTGLLIALRFGIAPWIGAGLALAFAVFHGHAHAGETVGAVTTYVAGFALTSLALQSAGHALGTAMTNRHWLRLGIGLALAGSGGAMLAAV